MPLGKYGGNKGKTKATPDATFTDRLRELQRQAKETQNALQGKHQRQWQVPSVLKTSLLDVPNLHKPAFAREELNKQYDTVTKDIAAPGTNGDVIAIKMQIDYNAMEERAFRSRHTSMCRATCLGHARRYGQGHGSVWAATRGIEGEVASFIAAGGAKESSAGGTV